MKFPCLLFSLCGALISCERHELDGAEGTRALHEGHERKHGEEHKAGHAKSEDTKGSVSKGDHHEH